jgi:uncharacterized protein (TIGR00297 family)
MKFHWQSRLVLLLVLPAAGADLVLEAGFWAVRDLRIALWCFGICAFFAAVVLLMKAGTPMAAAAGFAVASSLIFSTVALPFSPFHTAFTPACVVFALAALATRFGRGQKEVTGIAEAHSGRNAAQVCANLGVAMLFANQLVRIQMANLQLNSLAIANATMLLAPAIAALSEAAADTVSSEIGQSLSLKFGSRIGTRTRLLTTLRAVKPGTDGGISLYGTLAGIVAAMLIALAGTWALGATVHFFWLCAAGGVFGLFFDSLLGATLERKGWLNNDMVNFLSTLAAALFTLLLLVMYLPTGMGFLGQ